jgi:hypothetical protein
MEEDENMLLFKDLRIKKFNRTTYVLNGAYELRKPIHDEMTYLFEGFNLQGGQYKKMFENIQKKPCSFIFKPLHRKYIEDFRKASSTPIKLDVCPIAPMNNTLTNYVLKDYGLIPFHVPGNEKWRIDVRYVNENDKIVGGYDIYGILRTEKSLLEG